MTAKALALLAQPDTDGQSKGFFLQVEGASIDKRDHAQDPCGQIGETVAFDKVVEVGLQYAAQHPDTLVIVTADHAHTSQIIEPVAPEQTDHPGAFSVLITADGAEMTINYATAPPGISQSHTGA
jgi:alkaline phosphatase